jgi:phosphatidylserine/phosphatidylglycerophosphate/cardiolipin synthase-like enzyme
VDIKVLLEKNIYKSANLNLKTFLELQKNNISVSWSNPKNFKLNHSKIIIIDDELILSSGNLTYSTFSKNTDFFIFTKNFNIVEKFKKIFLSDFEGKKDFIYDHNIVLSPNYTKEKFDFLFNSCKKSLKMYIPSI